MKLKAVIAATTLSSLCALSPLAAQAQSSRSDYFGNYIGGSIGDSDLDTTIKIYGGQARSTFGWEASYVDFGKRSVRLGNTTVSTDAWAMGAAVVGILPFNSTFSGFGKLGLYYVKTRVRAGFASSSDSDLEPGIGVGLNAKLNSQLSLRAELENFGGEGGDLASVGLQFRF